MLLEVGVDEPLQRADARAGPSWRRTVSGTRSQPSASRQLVGGHLPLVEPVGEVPQRALAPAGLVDRGQLDAVEADRDQERAVGAPRHAALDLDLALGEDRQSVGGSMPVGPRARVACGVEGIAAERAGRPAGGDQLGPAPGQGGHLLPGGGRGGRCRRSSTGSPSSSTRSPPRRPARPGRCRGRSRCAASRPATRPAPAPRAARSSSGAAGRPRAGRRAARSSSSASAATCCFSSFKVTSWSSWRAWR